MRGATLLAHGWGLNVNISIHAPHAGRDQVQAHLRAEVVISIHAPHAGRDGRGLPVRADAADISIHAPHAGRDWR